MKIFMLRLLSALLALLTIATLLACIEYLGGQPMGLFAGSRPSNLGYTSGKFALPSWKPNSVSSTIEKTDAHYIEPLAFSGAPADAWKKLHGIVKASTRANIITDQPGYIYAEFKSAGLGFVDDVEFALVAGTNVIHVRSASRLGIRDLGVNRARIESIRAQFAK